MYCRYKNALGSFVDAHTVKTVDRRKRENTVTARRVLVAVGGRPTPLPCEGGEYVRLRGSTAHARLIAAVPAVFWFR